MPPPSDDKKLSSQLRKMGLNPIPSIEEVNFFKEDGKVLHFGGRPKVHTSLQSNTFSVQGHNEEKDIQELLPGILTQMSKGRVME
jgi:nascent polypeptide-associated complex subunit beta